MGAVCLPVWLRTIVGNFTVITSPYRTVRDTPSPTWLETICNVQPFQVGFGVLSDMSGAARFGYLLTTYCLLFSLVNSNHRSPSRNT